MEKRYYTKKILQDCIMSEGLFEIRDKKCNKWFLLIEGKRSADKIVQILNRKDCDLIKKEQTIDKIKKELTEAKYELSKYQIQDTYGLSEFIDKEVRKTVIKKLEKIKDYNKKLVFSSQPIDNFINDQINELQEGNNGRKI